MTSLSDKVARVKELDAKRTQGVITTDRDKQRPLITTPYDGHHCLTPDDVAYYNHAPQMAALIAQLWDEREQQRAVMVEVSELIGLAKNTGSDSYLEKAIASLNKALGK